MSVLIAMRDAVFARMLALEFHDRGAEAEILDSPALLSEQNAPRLTLLDAAYLAQGYAPPARGDVMILGYPEELEAIPVGELTRYFAVTRPFAAEELFASLFPAEEGGTARELRLGRRKSPVSHLALDETARAVYYKGERVDLTAREFALLHLLYRHRGTPVSREEAASLFGETNTQTNVVDVYINYLRTKLDNRFGIRLITTVRGRGYMLAGE